MLVSQGDFVETVYIEDESYEAYSQRYRKAHGLAPDVVELPPEAVFTVVHRVIPHPDWTEGIYKLEYVRGDRPVEGKKYRMITRRVLGR